MARLNRFGLSSFRAFIRTTQDISLGALAYTVTKSVPLFAVVTIGSVIAPHVVSHLNQKYGRQVRHAIDVLHQVLSYTLRPHYHRHRKRRLREVSPEAHKYVDTLPSPMFFALLDQQLTKEYLTGLPERTIEQFKKKLKGLFQKGIACYEYRNEMKVRKGEQEAELQQYAIGNLRGVLEEINGTVFFRTLPDGSRKKTDHSIKSAGNLSVILKLRIDIRKRFKKHEDLKRWDCLTEEQAEKEVEVLGAIDTFLKGQKDAHKDVLRFLTDDQLAHIERCVRISRTVIFQDNSPWKAGAKQRANSYHPPTPEKTPDRTTDDTRVSRACVADMDTSAIRRRLF